MDRELAELQRILPGRLDTRTLTYSHKFDTGDIASDVLVRLLRASVSIKIVQSLVTEATVTLASTIRDKAELTARDLANRWSHLKAGRGQFAETVRTLLASLTGEGAPLWIDTPENLDELSEWFDKLAFIEIRPTTSLPDMRELVFQWIVDMPAKVQPLLTMFADERMLPFENLVADYLEEFGPVYWFYGDPRTFRGFYNWREKCVLSEDEKRDIQRALDSIYDNVPSAFFT